MIGVLKALGRVWPLAQLGLSQVRTYAKEVLQRPVDSMVAPLPNEPIIEPPKTEDASGDSHEDFDPITISWMDELLQQPMPLQTGIQPGDTPVPYDTFLNL